MKWIKQIVRRVRRWTWQFRKVEIPLCQEILVPTFEIAENPEIRISEVTARRFYIVDRKPIIPPYIYPNLRSYRPHL